jgi:hypothetical protein
LPWQQHRKSNAVFDVNDRLDLATPRRFGRAMVYARRPVNGITGDAFGSGLNSAVRTEDPR